MAAHADFDALETHRASDILEIIALTNIYAREMDLFRGADAIMSVFTKDAYWDGTPCGLRKFSGYDEMHALFEEDAAHMAEHSHQVTNHVVEFDGPDNAHGYNQFWSDGKNKAGQIVRVMGMYEDIYRKVDGKWKIAGRVLTPLLTPELDQYEALR